MEVAPVRKVIVTEEHTMSAPQIFMETWGVGFGTCPNDEGQTRTNLEISALGTRHGVREIEDREGGNYWLLEAVGNDQTRRSLTVRYKVSLTLNQRTLAEGAPKTAPTLNDRARWLRTPEADDRNAAQQWAARASLKRENGERDVVFAQRLLDKIQTSFRYNFIQGGERGVPGCVRNGFGACGELNSLAVDVLRLNQIPARTRHGRNAGENVTFGVESVWSYHVAAEFWGEGIGWVPIEASAMGTAKDERGTELKPFLGRAAGDHVSKHYNFVHLDAQTRSFQNQDWVFGRWQGSWDGWKVTSKYGVVATPIEK